MPIPNGYEYKNGFYWRSADGAGPFVFDGVTPLLLSTSSARLHGDIRALLRAPGTNCSIHNASSVVSSSAGRLLGFVVIDPGTTPTLTAYDNASAASGNVLKLAVSGEWSRGAFLYCGPNGILANNGIYVALGGGAAPTVLAIFEGTLPTIAHTGTVRYFDGTNGNDSWDGTAETFQGGGVGPKLTMSGSDYDTGNWRLYFRRGTVVQYSRLSSALWAGTDMLFSDYGDTSLARPIIENTAPDRFNANYQFASGATTGVVEFKNIVVRYPGIDGFRSGSGFSVLRGARLIVTDCSAINYSNGVGVGGNGSRIVGFTISDTSHVSNGIFWGSSAFPCANRSLLHKCTLRGTNDGTTLHDGNVVGTSNAIVGSTLYGGSENCVDSLDGYERTLVLGNTMYQGTIYALSFSDTPGSGAANGIGLPTVIANAVYGGPSNYGLMQFRQPGLVFMGNYAEALIANGAGGPLLGLWSTVTSAKVENNTLWLKATSSERTFDPSADNTNGSSGTFRNNLILDDCTDAGDNHTMRFNSAVTLAAWSISYNYYRALSPRWADGTTTHTTFAPWNAAIGGGDLGTSTTDPVMNGGYILPSGSTLSAAGLSTNPVAYLGLNGVFWTEGQPSVGCAQVN